METIIIDRFKKKFNVRYKGLTKIAAKVCWKMIWRLYLHQQKIRIMQKIFENLDKEPLSQLKALILADNAEVIDYEPKVKWVGK